VLIVSVLAAPVCLGAWVLELPEEHVSRGASVTVAELAQGSVPAVAGQVVVVGRGQAGSVVQLQRSLILRKLVEAGCASGVVFRGASVVKVEFQGQVLAVDDLRQAIRLRLQGLVPPGQEGGPAPWFEMDMPELELQTSDQPVIKLTRNNPLPAGRSQVRVQILADDLRQTIPVNVIMHVYGEIPTARIRVDKSTPLTPELFDWQWLDLAEVKGRPVTSRELLAGSCCTRTLAAGDRLRLNDLKAIPLVRAGDMVELQIQRGGLLVTVNALARQDGTEGQTIPVKNQLNGRLVNARVTSPGKVEWRR
jgi:flagella basal body P-ring formation protein FlgA